MTEDVLDTVIGQLAETPIPSTRHMTPDERFLGVRQMWSDLHRLAVADGCIAAAWAMESLTALAGIRRVLEEFVDDVNATDGIVYSRKATPSLAADEDWVDLAVTYEKACEVLGLEPVVKRDRRKFVRGDDERGALA